MPEWLNVGWAEFLGIAAGVGAIATFLSNLDKIKNWMKDKHNARTERKAMPQKTLEAIQQLKSDYACMSGDVRNIRETLSAQSDKIRELHQQNDVQSASIGRLEGTMSVVSEKVDSLDTDVGDILCSQLTREHDYFMAKGSCPSADKQRLASIFQSYKKKGRNHLANTYFDQVTALPEK